MDSLTLGKTYCLRLPDGRALGHVRLERQDAQWLEGPFTPTPIFEEFRPLFEREAEMRRQQIIPLWEEAMAAIESMRIDVVPEGDTTAYSHLRIFVEGNDAILAAPLVQ